MPVRRTLTRMVLPWLGVSLAGALLVVVSALLSRPSPERDARRMLARRFDGKPYGVVVGIVDERGRRVIVRGGSGRGSSRAPDGDTLFELASVTKVITSLLLADMAERGEVAVDDPIGRYLPAGVEGPERNGKKITLAQLATHTSGLPSKPDGEELAGDVAVGTPGYATYRERDLYAFLSRVTLTRAPGSGFEYSNLGMGVLGHVLARRAGRSYEELVVERVCNPLGMASTRVSLDPGLAARLAPGHFRTGEPAPHWVPAPPLAGAGAFRSTANDMLTFLAAEIGLVPSPLSAAMRATQRVHAASQWPGIEVGLGWCVARRSGDTLFLHSGGVSGYRSFVGFSVRQRRGVVVLANSSTDIDDVGLYLLDETLALPGDPTAIAAEPVRLPVGLLDEYAGIYEVDEARRLAISREEERLFVQITGQPAYELFPESATRFFMVEPEVLVVFVRRAGDVSELVLHQAGREHHCRRLAPLPAVALDADVIAACVGRYQVSPERAIQVTRDGGRLFVQPTLQPREELYRGPAGGELVAAISDTGVRFLAGPDGNVSGLVLRQGGNETAAVRVEEPVQTVAVGPEVLEQLVGVYEHNPDFHLTVIRIGGHLFARGTGQPMHELHPLSETRYFIKTVPAPNEVTFRRENGRVISMTVSTGREIETSRKIR